MDFCRGGSLEGELHEFGGNKTACPQDHDSFCQTHHVIRALHTQTVSVYLSNAPAYLYRLNARHESL